ncbi:unnamed protein product [Polarella glacialis]|uniref:Glutathione peroxidase n=1 Tax=Polarella glacialis TaxID=89957 RepID=A0A813L421_POLGL|nr:unnamed protein product [Polarella glacialis]|mmetsp:Transcript_5326/g.8663  ORF Transcript_5326/g.8663 Transcript_5326/m.8663 type:complete len:107 (-) Transcript_5326:416-736(-)
MARPASCALLGAPRRGRVALALLPGLLLALRSSPGASWAAARLGFSRGGPQGLTPVKQGSRAAVRSTALFAASSFYELSGKELDGSSLDFEQLRGKVVYAVNVASS